MRIDGVQRRSLETQGEIVVVLDQTQLPHRVVWRTLTQLSDACLAIREMWVRGAPLIGVTAAYGVALAMRTDPSYEGLASACAALQATRPTAVNLAWALLQMNLALRSLAPSARADAAWAKAAAMAEHDVAVNTALGEVGLGVLKALSAAKGRRLNILTHCNAGWLATIDRGTATASIYAARDAGIDLHVWVDETRPRNQGASLTAWELGQEGIPCTLIVDNAGGLLMQQGHVDVAIVGTDRTTRTGDVCNKIGTYLKALAAHDNNVPFYVAAPLSSVDFALSDARDIVIEERDAREVTMMQGLLASGSVDSVQIAPKGVRVANPGFDITPARLVTGLFTERGLVLPSEVVSLEVR